MSSIRDTGFINIQNSTQTLGLQGHSRSRGSIGHKISHNFHPLHSNFTSNFYLAPFPRYKNFSADNSAILYP